MSSHREAPSVSSLSAFVGLPTLVTLQVGSAFAFEVLEQSEVPSAEEWHVNLNITDFCAFRKPGDAHKTVLIMNVNPMPPKLSDSFDPAAVYEFRVDTNGDAVADIAFRVSFSAYQAQLQSGEETSFELLLDSSSGVAHSTFFGSPIQLKLQKFVSP